MALHAQEQRIYWSDPAHELLIEHPVDAVGIDQEHELAPLERQRDGLFAEDA